ncbi:MAG: response regulator transcription factor [Firmicutes bacterium]|nr:response regulator transcription factor [Bacillota bacterium]
MYRLLLVDDEIGLVKGLAYSLSREGFLVDTAADGLTALEKIAGGQYDLVVLDLMLPGIDGLEVCRSVRRRSAVPVIMLTAKGDDVDRIVGLEIGADDYMVKPFNTRELIARIRAVLRRVTGAPGGNGEALSLGDLRLDLMGRFARIGERRIELTPKEFDVLSLLVRNPGRVFARSDILRFVWGDDYYDERTVDVCVGRLRKKIEDDPANPKYVLTQWAVGYYSPRV